MIITLKPPIVVETDDDLQRVSENNPGYRFEREEDGSITVSLAHTKGGAKSGEAFAQLYVFAKRAGGKAFDASTGFKIGPGDRTRSPDASWLSQQRIDDIVAAGRDRGFWPVSPDVVIEVKSDTDDFADTIAKVRNFIERGAIYAVAIDPIAREVRSFGAPPVDLALDADAIVDA